MKPSAHHREIAKLKKLLSVRERQFQIAVKTLKGIVEFTCAPKSVFVSETQTLQVSALAGLRAMENLQRKKPLTVLARLSLKAQRKHAARVLDHLIEKYNEPVRSDDD